MLDARDIARTRLLCLGLLRVSSLMLAAVGLMAFGSWSLEGLADGDFFDLYYYAPRIFMTALGCATPLIAWLAGPRVGRWIVPVAFTDSCPRCQHPVMLDSERCTECGLRVTS